MPTHSIAARGPRRLLDRILESPDLARSVQALEPRALHQLVMETGLEECGFIVALATTEQLTQVFDADLWRSETAGAAEEFDAARFGVWLDVMVEMGPHVAAAKLTEMDFDFVTAALTQEVLVLGPEAPLGEDESLDMTFEEHASFDLGTCRLVARRPESWGAVLAVFLELRERHSHFFERLLRRCFQISNDYIDDNGSLYAVLTAEQQVMTDAAAERERRREEKGYVSPSDAAAFLKAARHHVAEPCPAATPRDLATAALDHVQAKSPRHPRLRVHLERLREQAPAVHEGRLHEVVHLANLLVAGCSYRSRRFRIGEAMDAVLSTCNLGLENWPVRGGPLGALPSDFLLDHDLATVFQNGFSVLHERVVLHAARRLVEALGDVHTDDAQIDAQLRELRRRLRTGIKEGTPWHEREHLDVIAILDQPAWMALLGLIDECPALLKDLVPPPGGPKPHRISSALEFIEENRQIERIELFLDSLEERLV